MRPVVLSRNWNFITQNYSGKHLAFANCTLNIWITVCQKRQIVNLLKIQSCLVNDWNSSRWPNISIELVFQQRDCAGGFLCQLHITYCFLLKITLLLLSSWAKLPPLTLLRVKESQTFRLSNHVHYGDTSHGVFSCICK